MSSEQHTRTDTHRRARTALSHEVSFIASDNINDMLKHIHETPDLRVSWYHCEDSMIDCTHGWSLVNV